MHPICHSSYAIPLVALLFVGLAFDADAQEHRKYGITNVVTIAGIDLEKSQVTVKDGVRGQRTVRTDERTRIQDARGEAIALAALEPWDRVVVDARPRTMTDFGPKEFEASETILADRIQLVIGSPGGYRSAVRRHDAAVRDRVVERLAASRSLQGSDLWVFVDDGHVILRGLVADESAEERALGIARRTDGVRAVTSELRRDPSIAEWLRIQSRDEVLARQVAERIQAEVFPDARLEEDWIFGWEVDGAGFEVNIDADMGTVTLSGEVPGRDDRERTIRTARRTPGVRSVESELETP